MSFPTELGTARRTDKRPRRRTPRFAKRLWRAYNFFRFESIDTVEHGVATTNMKIECACGAHIHDGTDNLAHKAHLMPDQEWDAFWNAVDDAVEKSGPAADDKAAACMRLRMQSFGHRLMWQCRQCGRLYIDDRHHRLQCFAPASESVPKDILAASHR